MGKSRNCGQSTGRMSTAAMRLAYVLPFVVALSVIAAAGTVPLQETGVRRKALVENLIGETSIFLECGQSDSWSDVEVMKRRGGYSDKEMAEALSEVLDRTTGDTNAWRGRIRAGAAIVLGKYGTAENLPLLRKIALAKDDPAAVCAYQSYQRLAPFDAIVDLVDETYGDSSAKYYRRIRGLFFRSMEAAVDAGNLTPEQRLRVIEFAKRRVAKEADVRDVLELDGVLSRLDGGYASSRERALNIGQALKRDTAVDAVELHCAVERLTTARDLILDADRRNAEGASGRGLQK